MSVLRLGLFVVDARLTGQGAGRATEGLDERKYPFKEDRTEDDKMLRMALKTATTHSLAHLASRRLAYKLEHVDCSVQVGDNLIPSLCTGHHPRHSRVDRRALHAMLRPRLKLVLVLYDKLVLVLYAGHDR